MVREKDLVFVALLTKVRRLSRCFHVHWHVQEEDLVCSSTKKPRPGSLFHNTQNHPLQERLAMMAKKAAV